MSNQNKGNDHIRQTEPCWIVRLVAKIHEALREHCARKKKESPQDKYSRRLTNATIAIAFFTAATIGIGIFTFFILKWQLDAMERDQRPIIWITNNVQLPVFQMLPDNKNHITWNFEYANYGKSFAKDLKLDHFMKLDPGGFKRSWPATGPALGGDLPPGGIKANWGTVVSEPIERTDYDRLLQLNFGISILLEFEYWDAIGNKYPAIICLGRIITGAIATLNPTDCKKQN